MVTLFMWKQFIHSWYWITINGEGYDVSYADIFTLIFLSIFTIPFDLMFSPLELLVYVLKNIVEKILNKRLR